MNLLLRSDVSVNSSYLYDPCIRPSKVYKQRRHNYPTRLAKLLKDGLKVRRKLVA
jgi:hypothetical protein